LCRHRFKAAGHAKGEAEAFECVAEYFAHGVEVARQPVQIGCPLPAQPVP
jgi:hypothetical protein